MNDERMKRFVEEIRKQREEEFCLKSGHLFETNICKHCGKPKATLVKMEDEEHDKL